MFGETDRVVRVLGVHTRTGTAEAVAISVDAASPTFVGRWSLDLIEDRVERQIYHAVADLPLASAEPRVAEVIETVTAIATARLGEILRSVQRLDAVSVVIGDYPVPDSLRAILAAHTLMHAAEGAMFRDALLDAAAACRLHTVGVSRNLANDRLAGDLAATVASVGSAAGRPWRKEHKLATVAALTVALA